MMYQNNNKPSQSTFSALIKAILVLGLFGIIPGAWMVEIPLIFSYAAIKAFIHREYIKREIRRHFQHAVRSVFPRSEQNERLPWWERLGLGFGNFIKNTWLTIAKGLVAFLLLFTLPVPWSLFALYGLYRHNHRQLKIIVQNNLSSLYDLTVGIFKGTTRSLSFNQVLRNVVICSFLLVGGIYYSGELFVVDLALTILQSMIVWIGLNSAMRDFAQAFKTPLRSLCNHIGKIMGAYFGRYFAYSFMTGKVVGSLGPAVGQVESTGLLSEILSPLFSPAGLRFSNMSLLGRLLSSDFAHLVNSAFTSVFFTHSMQLSGDFYGVIGPTHFQIFLLMGVGCLVGYVIERVISACYNGMVGDCEHASNGARPYTQRAAQLIYRMRWHIGFIVGLTPWVMFSSASAPLIAFASGSLFGASVLALGGLITLMTLLYLIGHGLQGIPQRWLSRRNGAQHDFSPKCEVNIAKFPYPNAHKNKAITHQYLRQSAKRSEVEANANMLKISIRSLSPAGLGEGP